MGNDTTEGQEAVERMAEALKVLMPSIDATLEEAAGGRVSFVLVLRMEGKEFASATNLDADHRDQFGLLREAIEALDTPDALAVAVGGEYAH